MTADCQSNWGEAGGVLRAIGCPVFKTAFFMAGVISTECTD